MTYLEPMLIFYAIAMPTLAGIGYMIMGIFALSMLERHWRIARITDDIEGWRAYVAVVVWPLTAAWLLWEVWRARRG